MIDNSCIMSLTDFMYLRLHSTPSSSPDEPFKSRLKTHNCNWGNYTEEVQANCLIYSFYLVRTWTGASSSACVTPRATLVIDCITAVERSRLSRGLFEVTAVQWCWISMDMPLARILAGRPPPTALLPSCHSALITHLARATYIMQADEKKMMALK